MRLIIVLLAAALWCGSVQAQVPRQINYQGFLTTPSNTPVNGAVAMALKLYSAATGGAPLYSETQTVTVTNGEFSVLIGSETPLTLPFDGPYYLGITVGADPEMRPRQPVAASPYALRSVSTETLASSSSVPASQITGPIAGSLLANNLTLGGTTTGTFSGSLTGNVTGNVSGSAGNAVTFTGALAGNVTGTQSATVVSSVGGATAASVAAGVALANEATDAITANTLVKRNASGNFSANSIGIGTTSPVSRFHIVSGASDPLPPRLQSSGTTGFAAGWDFYQGATGKGYVGVPDPSAVFGSGELILFGGSGTKTSLWAGENRSITLDTSGKVGIGTLNPTKAKVEINGGAGTFNINLCYILDLGGLSTCPFFPVPQGPLSLYADQRIAANDFLAFSDERMKRIEGRSNSARDLASLAGIEVTDYSYVDTLTKGTGKYKKLIGQQVEKVYPQAVSRSTDVVPDIYKKAQVKDGWVNLATNLKKGERVRLIGKKSEGIHEVLEVASGRFRTDFAADGDAVFVYGREVKDFRNVDYDAIAMLNVSATQALNRRLEKQAADFAAQAEEMSKHTARIAELEQDRQAQATRIAELEKQSSEIAMLKQQMAELQAAGLAAGRPRLAAAR